MTDLLNALVVDDERPVLDELDFLLRRDPRIGAVATTTSGAGALRLMKKQCPDVVFLEAIRRVVDARTDSGDNSGRCVVVVDLGGGRSATLRVARRHTRELRDLLVIRTMVRLHTPDQLELDRGSWQPEGT